MVEAIALIVGVITTVLIALAVFIRDRRSITTRLFVLLALSLIGWSVTTYFSLHTSTDLQTLHWIRWIMFFVVVQNTSFFLLVHVFPNSQSDIFHKKWYVVAIVYSAITAVVAASPFLFPTFKGGAPQPGPGMALFLPHALLFAVGGIVTLIRRFLSAKGLRKTQLQYFLAGTILMFTLAPLVNFIVPVAFKNSRFVSLSPLFPIIFSGLIGYAIVTKRLFDIRAAVARAVGYSLTVLSFAAAYIVVAFFTSSVLFKLNSIDLRIQAVYIVLALVLAISFQSVKKLFDRVTNRLFYQDAYDPQELIRKLNRVLVATVGLDELLTQTLKLVDGALGPDFALVALIIPKMKSPYIVSTSKKTFPEEDLEKAHSKVLLEKAHEQVISTDNLNEENGSLQQLLSKNNVAILAKLKDETLKTGNEMGYLILGPKKSGNPYSHQDIRVMESIANELVIAIQSALRFEEIQQFNITLQQKIEDETRKLRKTNERLKVLDETKDDFISMASHQLRTPLTSVKGYLSLVLDGDAGSLKPNQRKLLAQAFISSQRMVYLIADLLNVSRLKTGKFVIETAPVNLSEIIQEEMEQVVGTAKSRQLTLTYHKPTHFPELMLDETKIRQVAMNFMDNAIYYTPSGGHIDVELIDQPRSIEFRVVDDGIGVPREEQHHLFTKFYRAKNAQRARPDGTGLGLFMAQKVVVAQGGAIIFSSKVGHGSTFGFTFPKDKLQVPATSTTESK